MESTAAAKFARLHELTGDSDWDPTARPLVDIIREFQVTADTTRIDGVFDAETSSALDEAIAGFA